MPHARRAVFLTLFLLRCAAGAGFAENDAERAPIPEVVVLAPSPSPLPDESGRDAIPLERFQNLAIQSPDDIGGLTPNLTTLGGGARGLDSVTSLRGLANSPTFTDPAVVYYIDGVPCDSPQLNTFDWHQVQSLNVWKGPQEMRFGQNAPGGVIEIEEDAPKPWFSSTASVDYGSYNQRDLFGEFTGPLNSPDLSFLAAAHGTSRDGYLINTTTGRSPDGQNEIGGRFALRWAPAKTPWTIDLNVAESEDRDGAQPFTLLSVPRYQTASLIDGSGRLINGVQSLRVRYTGDKVETTLISSHRSYSLGPDILDDGFGGTSFLATTTALRDEYYQEIRVASKNDAPLQWLAGGSYQRSGFSGTIDLGGFTNTSIDTSYDQYAVFGNVTLKPLPFDKFSLTFGNRFQADAKEASRNDTSLSSTPTSDRQQRTWLNFAPKVEAAYQATEAVKLFASSGLAFRPGGYAPFPATTTLVEPYASERTWANEIGLGYEAPHQRFSTSASLFWNQTYGYQLERYQTPLIDVINVPEVASRGVEWQVELRPADGLTLGASLGYTLSTFTDYHDGVTGQDYSGRNVPYIPRMTWLLDATYRRPEGWVIHADARGLGDTDFDQANTPLYRQDAYAILDCRLGYEATHWAAYLYGENLTDTQYSTFIDTSLKARISGTPQTFGIEARMKW